jgi:hypothetical protein
MVDVSPLRESRDLRLLMGGLSVSIVGRIQRGTDSGQALEWDWTRDTGEDGSLCVGPLGAFRMGSV